MATQAAQRRASQPRETLAEYVRAHPSLTFQFGLRLFLLASWVRHLTGGGTGTQKKRTSLRLLCPPSSSSLSSSSSSLLLLLLLSLLF